MISEDFFNTILQHHDKQLPFVVYRKPNVFDVNAMLQGDDALHFVNDFTETGFVFAPFNKEESSVLIPLENSELITSKVAGDTLDNDIVYKDVSHSKEDHIELVKKGITAIEDDQFEKVVLSRHEEVLLEEATPISIFKKLLAAYPTAFVYCWCHPKVGLWLGATPETLLNIEGQRFSTVALAGTQTYEGDKEVVWEDKEKNEQQLVVDFITNGLESLTTDLSIAATQTIRAGNLMHLQTKISGQLKDNNLKDIIRALHPTPAVCGMPQGAARFFILENENYNRTYYTGFLGELNIESKVAPRSSKRNIENRAYAITKKSSYLVVNLRCMQLQGDKALLYVGGGITKASDPESEWQETVNKTKVIKKVL